MTQAKCSPYACKIFTVWEEDVTHPDGRMTRQCWIDHKPTVALVAVNEKEEILLIRQYRSAVRQHLLEIPAGTMDKGQESPEASALRELAEETGYTAGRLTRLFAGYLLPGYCNEFMYFFLAEDLSYAPQNPDEDEFIELLPTRFDQAAEMIAKGEIIDAKTVLGLQLALAYRNSMTKV